MEEVKLFKAGKKKSYIKMPSKIVVIASILAVIATTVIVIVACLTIKWNDDKHFEAIGDDWSCATDRGTPCMKDKISLSWTNWTVQFLDMGRDITCTDVNKQQFSKLNTPRSITYNDRVITQIKCSGHSTPCITEFQVCLKDFNVPPITLHCKYLGDFKQTENEGVSRSNQTAKCGVNGAKEHTYILDSGYNITKFKFNSEKILLEKAIPETEPT